MSRLGTERIKLATSLSDLAFITKPKSIKVTRPKRRSLTNFHYSEETLKEIKNLVESHAPKSRIANILNLTETQLIKIANENGIFFKGNRSWSDEEVEKLSLMSIEGFTLKQAAWHLQKNYWSVAAYASRHGIGFSKSKSRRSNPKEGKEGFDIKKPELFNLLNQAL